MRNQSTALCQDTHGPTTRSVAGSEQQDCDASLAFEDTVAVDAACTNVPSSSPQRQADCIAGRRRTPLVATNGMTTTTETSRQNVDEEKGTETISSPNDPPQNHARATTSSTTSLSTSKHYVYGDGHDSAEAYSAISVTSALVFGFAVTTFVTVEAGSIGSLATSTTGHIIFDVIMALTISLSAFGLVVMNLQYYQVRRMRVLQPTDPSKLRDFLKSTFPFRHIARGTTWISLALYLLGLLVLSAVIWQDHLGVVIVLGFILGMGSVAVVGTWLQLNAKYMHFSGKKDSRV